MAVGTGTPGADQDGAVPTGPMGSPGEILSVSGPLSINAPVPIVNKDFADLHVTTMYALGVFDALRPNLVCDQFCLPVGSGLTHNGSTKRLFFHDDLAEATTPLLENIDIDSVAVTGRYMELTQREYGNAVSRSKLLIAQTMIPFDPVAARKVGYNAGRSLDKLASNAMFASTLAMKNPAGTTVTGTIATVAPTLPTTGCPGYLSSEVLQEAGVMLDEANAEPFDMENYILLVSPRGLQHLRAETYAGGWRDVTMRNPGMNGNSIFYRNYVGTYEGAKVIVSRNLPAGKALLFGAEAFAKTWPGVDGFAAYPHTVIAEPTDKLKRFASVGWYWLGGYSIFRPQVVVRITHGVITRPFGGTNTAINATAYAEA